MTPWTVTLQAPLSMELSGQEYWSRLLFPTPGDLSDPGIEPISFVSPALVGGFLKAQLVKNPPAMEETWVQSLGWEDLLEKGKAIHSTILAQRIPWTV